MAGKRHQADHPQADGAQVRLRKAARCAAGGFLICLLWALPAGSQTLPATLTVNAGTTVTSFVPVHVFGNNMAFWIQGSYNNAVSAQVQAAGNYFLRFPGGSSSDDFHWNSSGSYDANHYWVPNGTGYLAGFQGCEVYRGTTSASYGFPSNVDDGSAATTWMSNADTDLPYHQWAYMDLGATGTSVNSVTLVWGNPYASTFTVQYDNNNGTPFTSTTESIWANTTAVNVAGTGGTQGVAFTSVNTRYLRILMTASSAGVSGAYAIAELYAYNGATQVSKNSNTQANQSPMIVSSTDPADAGASGSSCTNYHPNYYPTTYPGSTDFNAFMTLANSFTPHAIPLITVNVGTGTPSEAASWVYYANITKGYGIHYWQVGNEMNGSWETGGPLNSNDYGRRFIEYAAAMKAVDPSIAVLGPVPGSPNPGSENYDSNSYIQDFLLRLYNNPGGSAIANLGGVDFHWYPGINSYPAGFSTPPQVASFATTLSGWLSAVGLNLNSFPILMSEYNCNAGTPQSTVVLANGLWLADWLGQFITGFGPQAHSNLWDVMNGGNDHNTTTGGDLGYLDNSPPYQPHATYWAMQMMATHWAIGGDSNSHELVNSSSSAATLAAYADLRPDNVLSLMVINTDPTDSYATTLNLNGFVPNPTANAWTFNSTNYQWTSSSSPVSSFANPDNAPTTSTLTGVSPSFSVTFSPYSITVFQFTNSGIPTYTPTSSSTPTATRTATNTPTATLSSTFTSTRTFTSTPSPTSTPTYSPTQTPTASPTNSPTASPTSTVCTDGLGNTCTYSPTPTESQTSTPTPTASFTPTASPTATPSSTGTPVATSTVTASPTETDSMTPAPTSTSTATSTPTFTPTLTGTPTPSGTPTATLPWTATPSNSGIPFPNPVTDGAPLQFVYLVPAPADQVRVKIFTTAFRKIYEDDGLATAAGSHLYVLDWDKAGLNAANGLYYVVVEQETSGQTTRQVMKLLVER